jgi:nitroimidazol reductase NimA-like FMN-containing flavoprotein (pyridoxamine 5'-phosphate oxidase superfamily)
LSMTNPIRRQMDEGIRKKILTVLDQHRVLTIATLRPDGWPQATTVVYANDGLTIYFVCDPGSQKAINLARDDRVSLTIDHDTPQVTEITGLSMAAHAQAVVDPAYASAEVISAASGADARGCPNIPGDANGHLGDRLL